MTLKYPQFRGQATLPTDASADQFAHLLRAGKNGPIGMRYVAPTTIEVEDDRHRLRAAIAVLRTVVKTHDLDPVLFHWNWSAGACTAPGGMAIVRRDSTDITDFSKMAADKMAPSLELSEGPALSKAALKLLARLYKGAWYTETAGKVPAAMAELEAAGLVTKTGRVAVMKSAYVPVGTRDFEQEKFPEMPRWLREKLKESA